MRRTAVTAGVTIVLTTAGVVGATAALSQRTGGDRVGGGIGDQGRAGLLGGQSGRLSGIPQSGTPGDIPTNGSQLPVLPQLPRSPQGSPDDDGLGRSDHSSPGGGQPSPGGADGELQDHGGVVPTT